MCNTSNWTGRLLFCPKTAPDMISKIQNFSGGACPQTPLAACFACYKYTLPCLFLHDASGHEIEEHSWLTALRYLR